MTAEAENKALFLGAGPQTQCGIGQFTRLLHETIEKLDPGSSTTLTLTQTEGSISELEGKRRDIDDALAELNEIRAQCIGQLKSQNGG